MQFNIQVISVEKTTKPTQKSSYVQLEVAFKNLNTGKVEAKKIMSFSKPETVFKALQDAKQGDVFLVTSNKNEGTGYWDWTEVVQQAPSQTDTTDKPQSTTPASMVKSTYETPEERAEKQRLIVRQSSLAQAIIYSDEGTSLENILSTAEEMANWVYKKSTLSLTDMDDDIPF